MKGSFKNDAYSLYRSFLKINVSESNAWHRRGQDVSSDLDFELPAGLEPGDTFFSQQVR
jgi:hypothetical protein